MFQIVLAAYKPYGSLIPFGSQAEVQILLFSAFDLSLCLLSS
jgi:hypothetical protein